MKSSPVRVILLLDAYAIACIVLLLLLFAETGLPEFSVMNVIYGLLR
jgi:hypothetical protein